MLILFAVMLTLVSARGNRTLYGDDKGHHVEGPSGGPGTDKRRARLKVPSLVGMSQEQMEAILTPDVCKALPSRRIIRMPKEACGALLGRACYISLSERGKRVAKNKCNGGEKQVAMMSNATETRALPSDTTTSTTGGAPGAGTTSVAVYVGVLAVGIAAGGIGALLYRRGAANSIV